MSAADDELRLARLADIAKIGGEAALARFLERFREQLQALRAEPDWSSQEAHKIVGLAGILGFGAVERAWSGIEFAEGPIGAAMREEAMAAIDEAVAFIEASSLS